MDGEICYFCKESFGEKRKAIFKAPQETNGKIEWLNICKGHALNWYDEGCKDLPPMQILNNNA